MQTIDLAGSNVVPLHPATDPAPATCKVAPRVVRWVRFAERDGIEATTALHQAAPSIHAGIGAADHAIGEQLQCYVLAHQEHKVLGLQGFHPIVSPRWYWTLLMGAAALESPVNRHALSFLGMPDGETWAVAGFVSVLNVVAASYFGKRLRQVAARPGRDGVVLGAVAAVCAFSMTVLAGLRADHIVYTAAAEGLPTSDWSMAALLGLQALFFVVGGALSFAMVPADERLQRVLADKSGLRRRIDTLLQQRAALAARHDRLWLDADRLVRMARAKCQLLAAEYWDENSGSRRSAPMPSWAHEPLHPDVFEPVDLGPRLVDVAPSLDALLAKAERQALADVAVAKAPAAK